MTTPLGQINIAVFHCKELLDDPRKDSHRGSGTLIVAPVRYGQSLDFRTDPEHTNFTEYRPILAKKEAYSTEVWLPFIGFVKAGPLTMR